jgi:UPF0755 protein
MSAALFAALLMLVAIGEFAVFMAFPAGEPRSVIVRVYPGTSLAGVADALQQQGVITSAWKFRWLARLTGKGAYLRAGEYDLNPGHTPGRILDTLAQGKVRLNEVTIPEGYNMVQIAATLQAAGLVKSERFLAICADQTLIREMGVEGDTLEGYLFPDTYDIPFYMSEEAIIRMMVKHFKTVWGRYGAEAKRQGMSMRKVVTLASIVEKETGRADERPLVSAVFRNRLRQGMRLQSDPTVIYGLSGFNGDLTRRDLLTPHPYNTYTESGLPAGPIANPGEASIKAALRPAQCQYLYFVSRNDGSHQFSCCLSDHNAAVNHYQRRVRNTAPSDVVAVPVAGTPGTGSGAQKRH